MAGFERFEDIEAWKEAKESAADVYRFTNQGAFRRDFGLKDQIRRAAVSVMANIAEGFGRRTNKDFAHFLYLSKGSAMEVISHLYIAQDLDYIKAQTFEPLYKGYTIVIAKLIRLVRYLESNPRPRSTKTTRNQEPGTRN